MSKRIRIGTFTNPLALKQAHHVADKIRPSGYAPEITGLNNRTRDWSALENALLKSTIDVAVIPASYVPAPLNDAFEIIAFTERGSVNDVLLSRTKVTLAKPGIRIGTNSPRRKAFLNHFYPKAEVVSVSTDVTSRLKKMHAGGYALLLNHADVQHLELDRFVAETIETSYFVPPAGQASLAVICHKKLSFDKKEIILRWVNHEETEDCIRTERAFLKNFSHPEYVFAYARFENNLITLKAGIISPAGEQIIKVKHASALGNTKEMAKKVAHEVLHHGGTEIMRALNAR